jgi:hypothetical protein
VAAEFAAGRPDFAECSVLRLRPDQHHCDGFYAVRWVRHNG